MEGLLHSTSRQGMWEWYFKTAIIKRNWKHRRLHDKSRIEEKFLLCGRLDPLIGDQSVMVIKN